MGDRTVLNGDGPHEELSEAIAQKLGKAIERSSRQKNSSWFVIALMILLSSGGGSLLGRLIPANDAHPSDQPPVSREEYQALVQSLRDLTGTVREEQAEITSLRESTAALLAVQKVNSGKS